METLEKYVTTKLLNYNTNDSVWGNHNKFT